ncbi:MFS transporter [Peribacillus frigoritolerans]|uniref:MFS transporter n=1 Tax=Peribacillus frigoritolerans TaxID=450367 RepID=UPI0039A1B506
MQNRSNIVDDSPWKPFHLKLTLVSSGGPFLDGYILSIIGIALVSLNQSFEINSFWNGLLSSSTLIGMFVGAILFGYLTDKLGREFLYKIDLWAFFIISLSFLFVNSIEMVFLLRFLLGVAIGADYPIATSLLTEFAPKKYRGKMLGFLISSWFLGAIVAYIVGYVLLETGVDSWKLILATAAIPTLFVLMLRTQTPESPRWLRLKGEDEKALAVLQKLYGPTATLDDIEKPNIKKVSVSTLFAPQYRKRMLFVCLFWNFGVVPIYAVYTFVPTILSKFHLNEGNLAYIGSGIIEACFLIGCIGGLLVIEKLGRRKLLLWGFWITSVALLGLSIFSNENILTVIILFSIFALFAGASNILEWIYPNELFPTEVRASAVGFATAASRFGAATGTMILPFILNEFGLSITMLFVTIINVLGLVVTYLWAPETTNQSLEEASATNVQTNEEQFAFDPIKSNVK